MVSMKIMQAGQAFKNNKSEIKVWKNRYTKDAFIKSVIKK